MPGYGTNVGADAYLTARYPGSDNLVLWLALDTGEKDAARLVASEYIDNNYSSQFPGFKTGQRAQERQWPRTGAYDRDGWSITSDAIPIEVENATYELSLRYMLNGELQADYTAGEAYTKARIEGAISVEFAGSGSFEDSQTVYTVVDGILAPILSATHGGFSSLSGRMVRT